MTVTAQDKAATPVSGESKGGGPKILANDDEGKLYVSEEQVGEVQATPTEFTLLGRLKDLLTGIVLSAGTALIGKVGIDQTTDGTTNAVHLKAGTALVGKAGIDQDTANANEVVVKSGTVTAVTSVTNAVAVTGMGEVTDTPTSYTLLRRLKDLLTGIVLSAGTNLIGKVSEPLTVETPFTGGSGEDIEAGVEKLEPGAVFKLTEIELHLSAAPTSGTQNLVIKLDDGVGDTYDLVILTLDLVANAVTDLVVRPNKVCKAADVITAAWTNTDNLTWGLKYKHQLL